MHEQSWPTYEEAKCVDARVQMAVQVCGKLRGTVEMDADASQEAVQAAAMELKRVQDQLKDKKIVKVIYVKGRLINIVAK